jgi:putative membrane protein
MAHMHDMMGPMWWAMWIPSLLIIGGLLALGVWAVRRFSVPRVGPGPDPPRILEERFARGEIDEDEFRRRLATLEGQR